ncbi:MAG: GNAT family N-acetyltransferase, partial [Burkholderiales bacterium]|nr:GNAT family N-acetyltransferase [Burkholderiales bacterium]
MACAPVETRHDCAHRKATGAIYWRANPRTKSCFRAASQHSLPRVSCDHGAVPIKYRKFAPGDVDAAHRLSLAVGWPHRREDWQFVLGIGSGYVAVEGGRVVGTILYWKHDARHASLGMVIVDPASQGRGIGRELMSLALRDLEGRCVQLNATPAGKPLYERLGFKAIGRVQQHQGLAHAGTVAAPARG